MDLVSVIVVSYNSKKYIEETLESIRNQSYTNIELIITDDASRDDTLSVASAWTGKFADFFHRVQIIVAPSNTGTPGNCNRGCSAATGRYLKLIAADDVLSPDCISTFVTQSKQLGADFLFSDLTFIDGNSNRISRPKPLFSEFFGELSAKQQLKSFARNAEFLNVPSWFYTKDLWQKVGGFDESFFLLEDQPFLLNVLDAGIKAHYLAMPLVLYRVHTQSSVVYHNERLLRELIRVREERRVVHMNLRSLKDNLYYMDEKIHYKYAGRKNKKLFYLLRMWNPAFWFKYLIGHTTNTKHAIAFKKLLS